MLLGNENRVEKSALFFNFNKERFLWLKAKRKKN
jgi:hypothetical protein